MKVNFKPLPAEKGGRVLIKQDEVETTTKAGVILIGGQEAPLQGTVMSVSDGVINVKEGDRVQWQRYRESPVKVGGIPYVVVEEIELHGKFL